ncbi:MAG: DUF1003 domain-containing protein [Moorellaceae bacterium]
MQQPALDKPTLGQLLAEKMARFIGSWAFLITQTIFLAGWMFLNVTAYVKHWDPYPFILLNLFLSLQAAYTGPLLLIAANRQEEIDRRRVEKILHLTEAISVMIEAQKEMLIAQREQAKEQQD